MYDLVSCYLLSLKILNTLLLNPFLLFLSYKQIKKSILSLNCAKVVKIARKLLF